MDNSFYNNFLESSETVIKDGSRQMCFGLKKEKTPFLEYKKSCYRFYDARLRAIENIDEELNRFESQFSNKHNAVFWASDYNDVFESLKRLFKTEKTRSVRLPNINSSTIFRELGIKYFLSDQKIELRDDADMNFFAADMMFSDNGSLLLSNQTNNTFSKLSNKNTNVIFITIDRIICNSDMIEVYQQLMDYRNGGASQDMIVFKGSPNCSNYLFIIDNQRSNILAEKNIRKVLSCIECGRCNDVCPVYQSIGDEPYNNVFTGPISHITLPYLETFESYKHLVYACTLCGACEEVCPLELPIREMIVNVRQSFFSDEVLDKSDRRQLTIMRRFLSNRSKMNTIKILRYKLFSMFISQDLKKSRRIQPLYQETFNKAFKKNNGNDK